jgi:saccharopine dehydrogenase (NAD+, L-lysine-forming)
MKTIVILGGTGYTGRLLASHLLACTDVLIRLVSRNLDKGYALAEKLNASYPGGRVSAVQVDASDSVALELSLQGADILLVAAPVTTAPCETVIRTAIKAGVDYLDIQIGKNKLALLQSLEAEIKKAGLCFITEAGFHPGLPSLLVRYASLQLDTIEQVVTAGYLNMGGSKLPYTSSADELMDMFKDYQAQIFKDGAWTKSSTFAMRKIDFGGDIGVKNCYSMYFPELLQLPQMFPSLREIGFYISESHWFLDYVLNSIVMIGLKLFPQRGVRPLGKLMWWGMFNLPKHPYRVELRVDAIGSKDGKVTRFGARIAHPDGYELTAVPVVATLLQILDGSARKPGLWMMGYIVDPDRLIRDMQALGVGFTRD